MNSLTGKLAAFITGLKYASLPPEVIQKAKHCLMDTLGAALAGSKSADGIIAKKVAEKLSPKKESTLITGKGKWEFWKRLWPTASCPMPWSWMTETGMPRAIPEWPPFPRSWLWRRKKRRGAKR